MSDPPQLSFRARFGLAAAWQSRLLWRLRSWCGLRIYGIYSMRITLPGTPTPGLPGFRARLFEQGDVEQLLRLARPPELELSESFVRDALAKGDVCLGIITDDALVAYTWCAFSPTHDDEGVFVRFDDAYRYAYKSFTLPSYRGQQLLRHFTTIRDRYCGERGRSHSIAFIDADNPASIRAAVALGSRRIGTAGYLKWGRVFWPFATAGARLHRFQFFMPAADGAPQVVSSGNPGTLPDFPRRPLPPRE